MMSYFLVTPDEMNSFTIYGDTLALAIERESGLNMHFLNCLEEYSNFGNWHTEETGFVPMDEV